MKLRQACGVICLVAFVCAVIVFVLPALPQKPAAKAKTDGYAGVLELWNVESFEGGCGSRQAWLTGRAAKFENKNKGLYVHVTTLSPSQAKDKLQRGDKFDIVGFSTGVGAMFAEYLTAVDMPASVPDNFRKSATFGNNTYAFPYLSGIYCLFARQSEIACENLLAECLSKTITRKSGKHTCTLQPLVCGYAEFNNPVCALATSGARGRFSLQSDITQYAAYEAFVSHTSAVTLLGTQRDLYRLSQRQNSGKIETLSVLPLNGYTDLVQYVGVCKTSLSVAAAKAFCAYLLSDEAQATLVNLGMFSVSGSIYTDETYRRCEAALAATYVPNVFADVDVAAVRMQAIERLGNGK